MHIAVYSTFYVVWVRWHLLSYLCSAITIQLFRLCAVMNLCPASSAYCEAVSRKCADTLLLNSSAAVEYVMTKGISGPCCAGVGSNAPVLVIYIAVTSSLILRRKRAE